MAPSGKSETWVEQASLGTPLIFIPHEPQLAIRHENRIATEWSRVSFTRNSALSTVMPGSDGILKT